MNSEDLAELASLYVLDALDEDDLSKAEAQFGDLLAFQMALSEASETVAMLAYGAPAMPMSLDLKDRLLARIAVDDALASPTELVSLLEAAQTVDWQPYQPTPGVQFATFRVDADARQVDCFVRSVGEVKFPTHRHAGNEEIVVLDGDLVIGDQQYVKGDRIYSQPGTVHQPETRHGCTLFLRTSLDDEILSS